MPRVYYREKRLLGSPLGREIIDTEAFSDLFAFAQLKRNREMFVDLRGNREFMFEAACLWVGDFFYKDIFLPDSIIFADRFAMSGHPDQYVQWPDEYFFVARIGQQLEVRKVVGKHVTWWDQTLDASVPAPNDDKFLHKLKNSFQELLQATRRSQAAGSENVWKHIPQRKIEACSELAALCGWSERECSELRTRLSSKQVSDCDAYALLEVIEDYCYTRSGDLKLVFMYFDWKELANEMLHKIRAILENNFGIKEHALPMDLPEDSQILESDIPDQLDTIIRGHGLRITQLKTDGDDFLFVVHRIHEHRAVKQVLASIGWDTFPAIAVW